MFVRVCWQHVPFVRRSRFFTDLLWITFRVFTLHRSPAEVWRRRCPLLFIHLDWRQSDMKYSRSTVSWLSNVKSVLFFSFCTFMSYCRAHQPGPHMHHISCKDHKSSTKWESFILNYFQTIVNRMLNVQTGFHKINLRFIFFNRLNIREVTTHPITLLLHETAATHKKSHATFTFIFTVSHLPPKWLPEQKISAHHALHRWKFWKENKHTLLAAQQLKLSP